MEQLPETKKITKKPRNQENTVPRVAATPFSIPLSSFISIHVRIIEVTSGVCA